MTYSVPTLDEIITSAMNRHRAELPGTDAFLWPNTEHVFLKVVAGFIHENYEYLDWIKRQRFVTEADGDQLDAAGKPFKIARKLATKAHGAVKLIGTPLVTVADATVFARSDTVQFALDGAVTFDSDGIAYGEVVAVLAGVDANTASGTALTQIITNADVTSVTVQTDGLGAGADLEDDESYRGRLLFRLQFPPRGGAPHDYIAWASEVSGVTRVWVEPLGFGPGSVVVWIMADDGVTNGIPGAVLVADVVAHLDTVHPATARVKVLAPTAASIDVKVLVSSAPSQTVQTAIETELKDFFRRQVHVSKLKTSWTLRRDKLWQAVARIIGSSDFTLQIPAKDVVIPPSHIPVLGTICYQT